MSKRKYIGSDERMNILTSRAGTHKIEVSDIIIFMHSIEPSMHKTDTHKKVFKKIDHNTS